MAALNRDGYPVLCAVCGAKLKASEEAVFHLDWQAKTASSRHVVCAYPAVRAHQAAHTAA